MPEPTRALVAERYGPPARAEAERPPQPGRADDAVAVAARRAQLVDAARAHRDHRAHRRGVQGRR